MPIVGRQTESVGSFLSYVNDAWSHEPEINKYIEKIVLDFCLTVHHQLGKVI